MIGGTAWEKAATAAVEGSRGSSCGKGGEREREPWEEGMAFPSSGCWFSVRASSSRDGEGEDQ